MASSQRRDPDARRAALDVLLQVERGGYLDALLGPAVERLGDPRDGALLTRLAYGVQTWRDRLDWTLTALANRELHELEPEVTAVLRLGWFQLLFLDRIPPHAAVDTSVELAKRTSPGGARLVNAVLRRAVREGERPLPDPETEPTRHLAIRWSHPQWLVERWDRELGSGRTRALLEADNRPGPSCFRVDLRRISRDQALAALGRRGVAARASAYAPGAIEIEGPVGAVADIGWLEAQGVASQMVASMLAVRPGERVLDLCAAPGGKAAALAETESTLEVVAADHARRGTSRLARRGSSRPNLLVLRADGTHPPFRPGAFDAVLVDAPCSGLGTLRAHPEVRWRRQPRDVTRLAGLQRRLLHSAAPLVRVGGRLVYATCTILAEENDLVVADFLEGQAGWRRDDPRPSMGKAAVWVGEDLALRTSPDRDSLDGFFAVVLRNAHDRV